MWRKNEEHNVWQCFVALLVLFIQKQDSHMKCLEQISIDSVIRHGAYIPLICGDACPPKIRYPWWEPCANYCFWSSCWVVWRKNEEHTMFSCVLLGCSSFSFINRMVTWNAWNRFLLTLWLDMVRTFHWFVVMSVHQKSVTRDESLVLIGLVIMLGGVEEEWRAQCLAVFCCAARPFHS